MRHCEDHKYERCNVSLGYRCSETLNKKSPAACTFAKRNQKSSRRKRSYAQLAAYENGAPSPFPSDGAPKSSSRGLSNSSLTVHKDGAYMQVSLHLCSYENMAASTSRCVHVLSRECLAAGEAQE